MAIIVQQFFLIKTKHGNLKQKKTKKKEADQIDLIEENSFFFMISFDFCCFFFNFFFNIR